LKIFVSLRQAENDKLQLLIQPLFCFKELFWQQVGSSPEGIPWGESSRGYNQSAAGAFSVFSLVNILSAYLNLFTILTLQGSRKGGG